MTPFDGDGVWLRCALHAHTTNSDGELAPGQARPPLRMGRIRRPRDHRPLGTDGRALDADAARHPLGRAERDQCGGPEHDAHVLALGRRGRPGDPGQRVRTAARRSWRWIAGERRRPVHRAHVLERAAHRAVGGMRRPRSGSRSGTRAASSRSAAATRRIHWDEALERGRGFFALATDDSHHPGYDSGFAWTMVRAAERSAGGGARGAPQRRASTARPARRSRPSSVDDDAVIVALQPGRERDPRIAGAHRGRAGERGPARLPARRADPRARPRPASSPRCRLERPCDAPYGRVEVADAVRRPRLDESAVDRVPARSSSSRSRRFDLLVVGGGIIGAGIAEAASAHGLAVALVDKGDFGGATSSASSKLIHGGLRYLRLGDVGLVREAHHERRVLMTCRRAAPRPPAAVPASALRRRPVPAVVRADAGSSSTRRSPARA